MYLHLHGISSEERLTALAGNGAEIKSKREVATDLTNLFPLVPCHFLIRFRLLRHWVLIARHITDEWSESRISSLFIEDKKQ